MLPWLALALLIILLDQLTKIVIERMFELRRVRPVTAFFNLVLAYNKGAAFSFLASAAAGSATFLTAIGDRRIGVHPLPARAPRGTSGCSAGRWR